MILQSTLSSSISAVYPTLVSLYCSIFIFTIFLVPVVHAVPASIWQFHIDTSPAPSPEDGPPGAAHALRNPAYLPVQITGIVCAYLACVLFISIALIFVGRRSRQRAQTSNSTLGVEMLAPSVKLQSYDPSPITPIKQWPTPISETDSRFWTSSFGRQETMNNLAWTNPSGGGGAHRHQPSVAGSVSTYNESVIQSDRDKAQAEMEKLYAAVMEHEAEQESRSARQSEVDGSSPHSPREIPPEFRHLQGNAGASVSPVSPGLQVQQQEREPLSPREPSRTSSRFSRTPLSLFSSSRASSTASNKSGGGKRRISFRGLPISPPMGSPDLVNSAAYAEDVPLSPRVYTPGPPPPTPGRTGFRSIVGGAPPTPRTPGTPRSPPPASQYQSMQPVQPVQPPMGQLHAPPPPSNTSTRAPPPHPLTILTAPSQTSTNSLSTTARTPNPLPFRSAAYTSSLSSKDGVPMSAPPTKTTYLERRESILHPAPRTGVPFTPYSPYMPYTPITPITPGRLVSKAERKREKKKGGLKVLGEDDMVLSEAEIWE